MRYFICTWFQLDFLLELVEKYMYLMSNKANTLPSICHHVFSVAVVERACYPGK